MSSRFSGTALGSSFCLSNPQIHPSHRTSWPVVVSRGIPQSAAPFMSSRHLASLVKSITVKLLPGKKGTTVQGRSADQGSPEAQGRSHPLMDKGGNQCHSDWGVEPGLDVQPVPPISLIPFSLKSTTAKEQETLEPEETLDPILILPSLGLATRSPTGFLEGRQQREVATQLKMHICGVEVVENKDFAETEAASRGPTPGVWHWTGLRSESCF